MGKNRSVSTKQIDWEKIEALAQKQIDWKKIEALAQKQIDDEKKCPILSKRQEEREERIAYDKLQEEKKAERDWARREGFEQGMKNGKKAGHLQGMKKSIALATVNMLKNKMNMDLIAQMTSLSKAEILKLK